MDLANELAKLFNGWRVEENIYNHIGGAVSPGIEFAIPHPEDPSVQIAIHAFEHAHIQYQKNVSPGSVHGGAALTINVGDR
jgi:hypothetical protein